MGKLYVFNWFTGVRAYGIFRHIIPYVEETLETLYENDRLLLVAGRDFTNDTSLTASYYKQSLVMAVVGVFEPDKFQGRQLQVTYDIEALRPNEIQLFVGGEHQHTLPVSGRCKRAILVVMASERNMVFFLRPVRRELYINSVQLDLY